MQVTDDVCAQMEDELLFCEDCRLYYRDSCPQHGAPTFILDTPVPENVPSRALLSLPEGLVVKERPQGGFGVWCTIPVIPRGCIFGPYEGDVLVDRNECTVYSWAVRENGAYFYIDASDESKSSWMRYVACASTEEEHNLTVFQYRGKIYYRACQLIPLGAELLVWIGEEYARTLGLKLGEHFKYEFGEKELLMKLFQDLHLKTPESLSNHVASHSQYLCNDAVSPLMQSHKPTYLAGSLGHPPPPSGFQLLEGTQNLVSLGRAQSRYWTFFGFQGDAYGRILDKTKIICKLCGVRLSYSGNTTNLRQHLIYKHRREYNELVGTQGAVMDSHKNTDSLARDLAARAVAAAPTVGRTTRAVADFIVRDLMPVEVIEGEGFNQMLAILDPNYKVPAASFLAHTILQEMQLQAKVKVVELVKSLQQCSVSLDVWKHSGSISYLTLTVHYVDEGFDSRNKVLASRPLSNELSVENLKLILTDVAEEWGIRESTSYAVGLNNPAVKLAASKLGWKSLPCVGQVLKGCIEAVLQHPIIQNVLDKCRKLVATIFSLTPQCEELSTQEPVLKVHLKMYLRDGTKWYSIYSLLQSMVDHSKFLTGLSMTLNEKEITLQQEDWSVLQDVVDILKPLAIATSTFTKDHFAGLSLVKPVITSLLYKHLAPNEWDSEFSRNIKKAVHEDLSFRYSDSEVDQVLNLACALDPRFRGLDFLSQPDRVETLHLLKLEASHLVKVHPAESVHSMPESLNAGPPVKKSKQDSGIEFLLGDLCNVRNSSSSSVNHQAEQEISSFQTSEASSLCQDPLQWWKMHHTQYPLLARAARKLLAVPATSVPTSWLFTDTGIAVYKKRCTLTPEHVDMLIFLNGNRSVL
ncbi:zinc finger BED domain-containing protein 1 [Microcaecilia unicolor]|uniref:Zinc finger BED domain-containing protein 1-like n=1 Tax=Microcaecilia unicolor TaxID=1415580 RepID=A0A6P7XEB4_9AMPH|nr:zinc finger BED domain-containing protein 1-like [Microcaecilia unicolor]